MVLAPRTTSASRAFATAALPTASRSTPTWRMKRRSSAVMTAATSAGGNRLSGTQNWIRSLPLPSAATTASSDPSAVSRILGDCTAAGFGSR